MNPNLRVLTLQHFGETPEEDLQVTLSAMSIKMVCARDTMVQDREVKETTVLFLDSEEVCLNLNAIDLLQLQAVVGSYGFFEE